MDNFSPLFDEAIRNVSIEYELHNLLNIDPKFKEDSYWNRLANLSFFSKLYDKYRYHFLYEIQGLSSQIHFGIACSLLFRERISTTRGRPNLYNHRYTFMLESTIHNIYSFWNRVAMVINEYLKNPIDKKGVYFSKVVNQLDKDYPELKDHPQFTWLKNIKDSIEDLNRNEFAHNNSLLMQNFLPESYTEETMSRLNKLPELLLSHNKAIVDEIYNLVELLEALEAIHVN